LASAPASPISTPPANIKLAAIHAIEAGKTKYTAVDGISRVEAGDHHQVFPGARTV